MTQPDQKDPDWRARIEPAIKTLALAILFLAGSISFGLGASAAHSDPGSVAMVVGALVMIVSGVLFVLALFD